MDAEQLKLSASMIAGGIAHGHNFDPPKVAQLSVEIAQEISKQVDGLNLPAAAAAD
jgi:hypothetical protein